ncbi:hypothetical protein SDC9_02690 [bioreactor metagenome]|uniref:Uncharacterized protein n=1 Tax=bioreactor metagenome TaxID=1076179 RepID=A0A644SU34_9ZZZZ
MVGSRPVPEEGTAGSLELVLEDHLTLPGVLLGVGAEVLVALVPGAAVHVVGHVAQFNVHLKIVVNLVGRNHVEFQQAIIGGHVRAVKHVGGGIPRIGMVHVLDHGGAVGAAPVCHAEGVGEPVEEADVADLRAKAPGASVGQGLVHEVDVGAPAEVAIAHEGREVAVSTYGRQALGTVLDVAVVAGSVPAEHAGHAPVELVFHKGLGQPALTLGAAVDHIIGVVAAHHVEAAHLFDKAVVGVEFNVPGFQSRNLNRQASPEHGAVFLGGIGHAGHVEAVARTDLVQIGVEGGGGGAIIEPIVGESAKLASVAAHHAGHDPWGDADAVKGQGHAQGKQVHVIKITGLVVADHVVVGAALIVVVEGAHPQGGEAHVFVKGIVANHSGSLGVKHRRAASGVGQGQILQAHLELEIGLRNRPLHVGLGHAHQGAVRTKGGTLTGSAPVLRAKLELHAAHQVF